MYKRQEYEKEKYRDSYVSLINDYKNFINKYPDIEYSKTALISSVHLYGLLKDYEGMKIYLQGILKDKNLINASGLAKRYMIEYYSRQKDYAAAIKTADEILSNKEYTKDSSLICEALYAKGYIYSHNMDNQEEAVKCFSEMVNKYSENSLITLAENELELLGIESHKNAKENPAIDNNLGYDINSYPNPFNPTTVINYSLPIDEKVLIKVYDILGREITELVNEFKTAGKYSVQFNGSNFSSGVYFYSITAGNFNKVNKMILLR